jgi:hypothetical protein
MDDATMYASLNKIARTIPFALCLLVATAVQAAPVGSIEKMTGDVSVGRDAASLHPAKTDDPVNEGDLLSTGNGEAMIRFSDNSILSLRPQTRVVISSFKNPEAGKGSYTLGLLRGAFRAITGLIGKAQPQDVHFNTPTATIGIRGTDFELAIQPEDTPDARAGTYNYVYSGGTRMAMNDQRENTPTMDVQPEQTGVALANPGKDEAPLQILKQRPAFLRGGGFDAHMMQMGAQPIRAIQMMPRR